MPLSFTYPPTVEMLQWLAGGSLAQRLPRALRLWVLLHRLYSAETDWAQQLPAPFHYSDLRQRLFAPTHGQSSRQTAAQLSAACQGSDCLCQKSIEQWLAEADLPTSITEWQQRAAQQVGLAPNQLPALWQQRPFFTVHRSLRNDLRHLAHQGWLQLVEADSYRCIPAQQWPQPPGQTAVTVGGASLSVQQTWELLRILESVAFVQPNLELAIQTLWEQAVGPQASSRLEDDDPQQRIFVQLDYILPPETQERVDTYQEQIEQLWRSQQDRPIQFHYWRARQGKQVQVVTYPVCLHYIRRAKYLSAYGQTPDGTVGWHNYRLDRIASARLTLLDWNDSAIPPPLQDLQHTQQLPTSDAVKQALEAAWGFDFYRPRALLIMRFPPNFARWYVDNTQRHPTFQPIAYHQLPPLIRQEVPDPEEQQQLLQLLQQRSATDAYYRAWIRLGDVNLTMRLRAWRPNGEAIAPLSLRQLLAAEVAEEGKHYGG